MLNATNDSLDPFDYHFGKCGVDFFKTLEHTQIYTCWPRDDDDDEDDIEDGDDDLVKEEEDLIETSYCNGSNEVVNIFEQKRVICYERDSVYAFRQCGHHCICEECYQYKSDYDILKWAVCRTQYYN